MASLSKGVTIQEFRSKGVEPSLNIAATERVRGLPPSGTPGSADLGPGDECILTEIVDSFPGDDSKGDCESGSIYPMRE